VPIEIFTKKHNYLKSNYKKIKVLNGFNCFSRFYQPFLYYKAFPDKIINIHPLYCLNGGKGMYGMYVHQAVVENKELETELRYTM
jgi:phosphoribosylglycinamide formyltransferase-1